MTVSSFLDECDMSLSLLLPPSPTHPLTPVTKSEPHLIGAGLFNLGNTCFLNAVLQCITHTVPFVQALRSFDHGGPCPCGDGGFCVLCALRDHINLSLESSGKAISPKKFVENISDISSSFQRFQQEDAHEFLQCFLNKLESCCLGSQDKPSPLQDDSIVKQIFGGCLRSELRCCCCGHSSDAFEPLFDLSLEIEDANTVLSALKSFTQVERIGDQEMKFTCKGCNKEVTLEKQFTLDMVPAVATLHLKRFESHGVSISKICKSVGYPLELDLQPFLTNLDGNNNGELKYNLYAVLVHSGCSPNSGHYFCFIRSSPESWYRLDDSEVTRVSEELVMHQEAYILFYARQGLPWFSSLMETQKTCLDLDNASISPKSALHDPARTSALHPARVVDYSSGIGIHSSGIKVKKQVKHKSPLSRPVQRGSHQVIDLRVIDHPQLLDLAAIGKLQVHPLLKRDCSRCHGELEEVTNVPSVLSSGSPSLDEILEEALGKEDMKEPENKAIAVEGTLQESGDEAGDSNQADKASLKEPGNEAGDSNKPDKEALEDGAIRKAVLKLLSSMPNSSQKNACISPASSPSDGSTSMSEESFLSL